MSIGTPEILVCLVIALLVLGPEKLPGAARTLGRALGEFRRLSSDVQGQVRTYLEEDEAREREEQREREAADAAKASFDRANDSGASGALESEAPVVEGQPGNAPAPLTPHPDIEGFRLIDEPAARPAFPADPEAPDSTPKPEPAVAPDPDAPKPETGPRS